MASSLRERRAPPSKASRSVLGTEFWKSLLGLFCNTSGAKCTRCLDIQEVSTPLNLRNCCICFNIMSSVEVLTENFVAVNFLTQVYPIFFVRATVYFKWMTGVSVQI